MAVRLGRSGNCWPVLLAAAVGLGGVASVRLTLVPRLAVVPAVGVWRITVPGSKSQLPLKVIVPTVSPAPVLSPAPLLRCPG